MSPSLRPTILSIFAAGLVALAAGPAAATHISISAGHDDIKVDHGDIVITADDDSEATVEPDGTLTVDGRRIRVAERDRQALVLYNQSIRRIEDQAMEIGFQGAGLAVHALTQAVVAITTGNEKRAERSIEAKAEGIKEHARQLCQELRTVEQLQDTIADRVRAFRPYAVLELRERDCRVDD